MEQLLSDCTIWDGKIPKISCHELSLRRFYEDFMFSNKPIIIDNLTESWGAMEWVKDDGRLDSAAIIRAFGACQVTVHNCSRTIEDMGRLETKEMSVKEYLSWWESRFKTASCKKSSSPDRGSDLLYLKDWNFCKEFPGCVYFFRSFYPARQ